MQNIKNIIFDLGGVILDIDYNLTRKAFEKLGVTHFDDMYSQASADKLFQKLETGHIEEADFYKELNRCTGLQLSPEEIRDAWNGMLLSYREKTLEYLEEIKSRYKIFLLSNTNFIHLNELEKIFNLQKRNKTFDQYFDKAFYSCAIGLRKPDRECYEWVINDLQVDPSQTLFIDDLLQNIEAAGRSGLQTILLEPGNKVENLGL